MKRRSFVKASIVTTALGAMGATTGMAAGVIKSSEFYELRVYNLKNGEQQKLVEAYFKNAAIPALNRQGIKNVGVFTEMAPAGQTKLFALIPYHSWNEFARLQDKLSADKVYQQQGAAYLSAPATEPAYERIESSLMQAFTHFPKIQAPANKPRIFELRRYEHATESAGKKKLEMFNDAGEVDIFVRLGFKPVFFSETLIGDHRPNLIYMITFDDMAAHDSHWKAFGSDPQWKKISAIPEYADAKLVSHITSTMLIPAEFSQI
ncbi:hypothetical protein BH09BAC6_BH09BAC6_22500 [soil metagenome]|jgi:hypothetical protein